MYIGALIRKFEHWGAGGALQRRNSHSLPGAHSRGMEAGIIACMWKNDFMDMRGNVCVDTYVCMCAWHWQLAIGAHKLSYFFGKLQLKYPLVLQIFSTCLAVSLLLFL